MRPDRPEWRSAVGFYLHKLVPAAVGFASLPWLYQRSGGAIYARYSILSLLTAAIAMLAGTWVSQAALRSYDGAAFGGRAALRLRRALLGSAAAGTLAAAIAALVWRGLSEAPWLLSGAVGATTLQLALVPVLQAHGHHAAVTTGELLRTSGAAASIVGALYIGVAGETVVEAGLLFSGLAGLACLWPAARRVFDPSQPERASHFDGWPQMLRFGAPLSAYNGLALWLQYFSRAATARWAASDGALLLASDIALRVVSAGAAPLVAAQVPHMIDDHRRGEQTRLRGRISKLQRLLTAFAVALSLAAAALHVMGTWIFESAMVTACAVAAVWGNVFLQIAVCAQKPLEFDHRTLSVAWSMAGAALAAFGWSAVNVRDAAPLLPGGELLVAAVTLLLGIALARRFGRPFI